MEFYRLSEQLSLENEDRFNSQRDGILLIVRYYSILAYFLFQFPTGWNSTIATATTPWQPSCFNSQRDGILQWDDWAWLLAEIVSIPNGMEFYRSRSLMRACPLLCFNSQRDGILRDGYSAAGVTNSSFNSQRDGILLAFVFGSYATHYRFNSQRDGILLKIQSRFGFTVRVSIPNGMEFYARVRYLSLRSARFNSQRDGILLKPWIALSVYSRSFNSQRDGILPKNGLWRLRQLPVSIPNGMEFYLDLWVNYTIYLLFQFPTGWNSTR